MSSGIEQIIRIEEKLNKLLSQHQQLLRENQKLRNEQEVQIERQKNLKAKIDELEIQVALLQSTESTASKTSRAALEKKINAYVKEIDKCIAILGNQA
jgi:chromosome segregation ATPase